MERDLSLVFRIRLYIEEGVTGVPETLRVSSFLQWGEMRRELTPFSVTLWQWEMSSSMTLDIFYELAKNIRKLSVSSIWLSLTITF